jgi:Uma2 family endonuclease
MTRRVVQFGIHGAKHHLKAVLMSTTPSSIETMADLLDRLGGIPLDRIRFQPSPGTATIQDVITLAEGNGPLCELVEGVLLEKAVGYNESNLAIFLAGLLNAYVVPRNLGLVSGSDGTLELLPNLVRIPNVAFTRWDRMPEHRRPEIPVPRMAPNLAVEVLSRGNTPGEMAIKRQDYFAAGVEQVWEVDPKSRSVTVYTSLTDAKRLQGADTIDGGALLPGFELPLAHLFAELDRHG